MAIVANDVRWTLSDIRTKVRNLSGRPSTNQISNDALDEYINRFYTQDLPSVLTPRDVEGWWRLQTLVNVPKYSNEDGNWVLKGPVYVNGVEAELFTDPTCFYGRYPKTYQTRENVGSGDASTVTFTGTLGHTPVDPENIVFDDDFERLSVRSRPKITNVSQQSPAVITTDSGHNLTTGDQVQIVGMLSGMTELDNVQSTVTVITGTTFQLDGVDSTNFTPYLKGGEVYAIEVALLSGDFGGTGRVTLSTGAFSITFNTAPSNGQDLRASYEFYNPGIPVAALYYDRELYLTPPPDGSYLIEAKINERPAPLINETDALLFDDWGKLVAYGAAIDFLNDEGQQDASALLERQFQRLLSTAKRRDLINTQDSRSVPRF